MGDDTSTYDASQGRTFIRAVSSRHGQTRTRSTCMPYGCPTLSRCIRMLFCGPRWGGSQHRQVAARLPATLYRCRRYRATPWGTCEPNCAAGSRDRAIILLLARLGLRAGDVRALLLTDIDWAQGRLRVIGKGRCERWLPLPQEVGDAMWHSLEHCRPRIDDAPVFLRVHAPFGPLPSSGPSRVWSGVPCNERA